jgi:hypothetical protein
MRYSSFEKELDAIRIAIYEEIKDMTPEEHIAYLKEQTAPIHEKYHIHTVSRTATDTRQKETVA